MRFDAATALAAALMLAGVINLLPLIGVLGQQQLQSLYSLPFDDASLRVLMRHRAVLFGLLGVALIVSAFVPGWRLPLALLGLASMVSFIVLAYLEGGGNAAIRRVVWADLIASLPLAAALLWGLR